MSFFDNEFVSVWVMFDQLRSTSDSLSNGGFSSTSSFFNIIKILSLTCLHYSDLSHYCTTVRLIASGLKLLQAVEILDKIQVGLCKTLII